MNSHFLSQKRPALPLPDVVKSCKDSYKTALGSGYYYYNEIMSSNEYKVQTFYLFLYIFVNYCTRAVYIVVLLLPFVSDLKIVIIVTIYN